MKYHKNERNKYNKSFFRRLKRNCTFSFSFFLLIIFLIFIQLIIIFFILDFPIFQVREFQNNQEEYVNTFHQLNTKTIKEWDEILRHGEIIATKLFISNQSAISEKFLCILRHKNKLYKAMGKLVENPDYRTQKPEIFHDYPSNSTLLRRKTDTREYQGIPEVIAYQLDKVLNFSKKPPTITRIIPSKLLYSFYSIIPCFFTDYLYYEDYYENFSYRSLPYKLSEMFYYFIESFKDEYNIYISLTPYLDTFQSTSPPSLKIKEYLTKQLPFPTDISRHHSTKFYQDLEDVSDIMLFDYLMDEHDRKAEKNWIRFDGRFIIWDNGLSFDHGPYNFPKCLDILCGKFVFNY